MMQWLKEEMCEREVMGSNPMGRKDAKNSELGQQVQKNLLFLDFFVFICAKPGKGVCRVSNTGTRHDKPYCQTVSRRPSPFFLLCVKIDSRQSFAVCPQFGHE